jgi:predicted glycosyltransferase
MKILIDMGHPAHVHLFKNFFWEMEKKGHEFKITARDKEVTTKLLDAYGIPYERVGTMKPGKIHLILEWIYRDIKIVIISRKFNPDILMGNLNVTIVHAAKILRKKSIIFTDSEPEAVKYPIEDFLSNPFADVIITLNSVRHNYGEKEVRVNTYKELAYLHPNWFTPDGNVLTQAGIRTDEDYIILRFVAWGAYHDVGKGGFDIEAKRQLIKELEPYARIFISSESELPAEFEQYRIPIRPEQIHDFLYYAKLLICDSQTMATEAAVLGTPVIRCNSFVGKNDMGNFIELEQKYNLIFNYYDEKSAVLKAIELLKISDIKERWIKKRDTLLQDKIDVTSFLVWFTGNYPESFQEMKRHPEIQYRFR